MARTSMWRPGCMSAASAASTPERTSSAASVWSCVRRNAPAAPTSQPGESPTCATSHRPAPERSPGSVARGSGPWAAATMTVAPMEATSGSACRPARTASLALLTAAASSAEPGGSASPVSRPRTVSTVSWAARLPPAWPPTPSLTTASPGPRAQRSWFSWRGPTEVAQAASTPSTICIPLANTGLCRGETATSGPRAPLTTLREASGGHDRGSRRPAARRRR